MPRLARQKSETGFYHILLRGVGRQNIFVDDEDKQRFLETLERYKKELNFELHAYCLMGNHVHLLIKDVSNQLDQIMKKIAGSYAYYFNRKHERVGHLFQDRFKSEVIQDDLYYLTVLRYIHQNPLKAGISKMERYPFSSYGEYVGNSKITDKNFAVALLGGENNLIDFLHQEEKSNCLDDVERKTLTDTKAREILSKKYHIKNFVIVQQLGTKKRNQLLHSLKEEGMSIRQIERITGLNRGVIQRA